MENSRFVSADREQGAIRIRSAEGAGERHGLYHGPMCVHVRDTLLQVHDAVRQGSLETHFRLDIKPFFSRPIFDVEARPVFREDVKIRKKCVGISTVWTPLTSGFIPVIDSALVIDG
jgi:hypothetical protein